MTSSFCPSTLNVPVGEMLVGRAWSWKVPALERSAQKDYVARLAASEEDCGTPPPTDYRISVFALAREPSETVDHLVERLISATKDGLNSDDIRWLGVVTETELAGAAFSLEASPPPPHHHDIALGEDGQNLRSQALSDLFSTHERIRVSS